VPELHSPVRKTFAFNAVILDAIRSLSVAIAQLSNFLQDLRQLYTCISMGNPLISKSTFSDNLCESNLAGIIAVTFNSFCRLYYIKTIYNIFEVENQFINMKYLIFSFLILLSINPIKAQFQVAPVLTAQDTMHISYELDKGISYSHTIRAKQTLYSISKFFNVSFQELLIHNDLTKESIISVGQKINIPLQADGFSFQTAITQNFIPVVYQVKSKETLFRIAKVYFPQTIESLVERNDLGQLSLDLNQQMVVGFYPIDGSQVINESIEPVFTSVVDTVQQVLESEDETVDLVNKKLYHKRGIAIWNKAGSDKTNAFVLHRDAKINSIIEIYNPVVNRTTMAKVVGKLPEDLYSSDVTMIISPKVAQSLGALDSRFMVEMSYD